MTTEKQASSNHPATQQLPAKTGTQQLSRPASQQQKPTMLPAARNSLPAVAPALQRLCAMKNTVDLTPFAIETWAAVLSVFDVTIVNEAVLRIGLSEDPFPDLGKLVARCSAIHRERNPQVAQGDPPKVGRGVVGKVAEALGLKIQ